MQEKCVQIIDTGVANIHSLEAAFSRLGCQWQLTVDPKSIAESEYVVLPGVGAFRSAVESIDAKGLRESIVGRVRGDRRTLAICLGMQLLCESSQESPGVRGLGVVPCEIQRFSDHVQVPQLGWNSVTPSSEDYFPTGSAYFANSFRLSQRPEGWNCATTHYDGEFVSSFWRSNTLACQFHPELSGQWGQELLSRWLKKG